MPTSVTVLNAGVPGEDSGEALRRLPALLRAAPDHLVVLLGMNDALNHAQGRLQRVKAYRRNLETIVVNATSADVRSVLLVGLHPVNVEYLRERHPGHPQATALQDHLSHYDATVRAVADATGAVFVDWRARFLAESPGRSIESAVADTADALIRCEANVGIRDGLHLTQTGARLLADEISQPLRKRLREGDRVICLGDSLTFGNQSDNEPHSQGRAYPALLEDMLRNP